jgi:hypothetical protein
MVVAKRIKIDKERLLAVGTIYPKLPGEYRFEDLQGNAIDNPPAGNEPFRLNMACPLGHGNCGSIVIGRVKPAHPTGHTWRWDGDVDKPTLTPSINCLSHGPKGEKYAGCGWHAFLTKGEFK